MIRLYKRLRCALWYGEHDYAEIDTHCPRIIAGFVYKCRRCGKMDFRKIPRYDSERM
jgi:hypothetical protein